MIAECPLRLGFAVKVLGKPGLKSNDTRRWQNAPHLKVSLEYLDQIFDYLSDVKINYVPYVVGSGALCDSS